MKYLPLHCFPNIHWLSQAIEPDVVIDIHEHYEKQTLRNRFEILGVNGRLSLTIPIAGQKGEKVAMKDIRIADNTWRKTHLTSIRSAYGRAAFFEFYFDEIASLFMGKQQFLADFNLEAIEFIRKNKISVSEKISEATLPFTEKEKVELNTENLAPPYPQVFSDRFGYVPALSVIDLLMNLGPRAADHILLWKNGK